MARANSLPAPNVKSAAVSWLSRINPSKGCESTCSLTAYGREFKHLAPARYDGFSWSINGFGADADFARDNFVWPSASRQRNHKAIENPSKCRGVGGGFHACRQQGPPIRRADTPLRRLRHGANLNPHRRPCRGDGLYGSRFAARGGWLAYGLPMVVPRLFCDRGRDTRQRGATGRQNLDAHILVFRPDRPGCGWCRSHSALVRGAFSDGVAARLVMGPLACPGFPRVRTAPARLCRRSQGTGERVCAVFDRPVPLFRRHVRHRAPCAADRI